MPHARTGARLHTCSCLKRLPLFTWLLTVVRTLYGSVMEAVKQLFSSLIQEFEGVVFVWFTGSIF